MNALKQKIVQLFSSLQGKIFILNNFNPSSPENTWLTTFLEVFVHFQYIFNISWIKGSLDSELYWLMPIIGFISFFLDLSSKLAHRLKGLFKIRRSIVCVIKFFITLLINALFIVVFENLTRGVIDLNAIIIFNLLINYILTHMSISLGYLSWQYMMMMFFFNFLITSGISLKNTKITQDHSQSLMFLEGYQLALLSSNLIVFFIVAWLIRSRISVSDYIEAMIKDTPVGKVIFKKESKEIIFANKTIYKILGIKERNLSFSDLNACSFKLTAPIPMVFHTKNNESPSSPKHINHRKILTLLQILESIKGPNRGEVLTFYTTMEKNQVEEPRDWSNDNGLKPSKFQTEGDLLEPETLQYEVKISFINWNNFNDKYLYIQFNDITELQKILETEKQIEFKTKILHSFSHELKTPLNISRNMIDLMIMDEATPNALKEKYIFVVRESFDQLEYIIQDIVDFLKIESSQFQLVISKFCLKILLQEVVESMQKRVEEHEVQIFLTSEINEDYNVSTDRSRLKRVLLNVLSFVISVNNNCVLEFSAKTNSLGGCDIVLGMAAKETASQSLELNVPKRPIIKTLSVQSDNDFGIVISKIFLAKLKGNGIDSYDLDHFESDKGNSCFLKFSTSSFLEPSSILEKNEGNLPDLKLLRKERKSLTNPINKKSKDISMKHLELTNISSDSPELKKPCARILIVDDDYFNLLSINLLLEKLNFFSIRAYNGIEAITILTKYQKEHFCLNKSCKGIELIIMDLMMPVMNGLECSTALLEMMKNGEIREIPILACTANDSKDVIDRCQQIGIKEVLSKPISLDILKKSVSPFLLT